MKEKSVWVVFWVMVAVFVIAVLMMFALPILNLSLGINAFAPWPVLFILGVVLIVLTVKRKVAGMLKKFLLLTGASAVGLPVFIILHNLVYGLFILLFGADFWGASGDEPVFFILATIVCPVAFLVGAIGTIVLAVRNKTTAPTGTS
jgi:hypothetical protein